MGTMLILGANSDIAKTTALEFAKDGWDLCLAGRNLNELERLARDIRIRTANNVYCTRFDALDNVEVHIKLWNDLENNIDAILCAVGCMDEQIKIQNSPNIIQDILKTNFTGLVTVLSMAANTFEKRKKGLIIGISSVAGDRGRASNYIYGASKSGFSEFLSGLRQRLSKNSVRVITVKPGYVNTKMTEQLMLPKFLTVDPVDVSICIKGAVNNNKDIIYVKWIWKYIMIIIKFIPESIFKKVKF